MVEEARAMRQLVREIERINEALWALLPPAPVTATDQWLASLPTAEELFGTPTAAPASPPKRRRGHVKP